MAGIAVLPEGFTSIGPLLDVSPVMPVGIVLLAFIWQSVLAFR